MDKRRYVLLEPGKSRLGTFARLDAWVCRNTKDIAEVAARASKSSVWISFGPKADDDFLKAVVGKSMIPGRLLTLKPPRMDRIPLLSGFFLGMIGIGPAFRFLPDEELVEVLHLPRQEARNVFLGGAVDVPNQAVSLIRGDVTMVVVPLTLIRPNRITKPDPSKLAFTDYGQTVCLGEYEASADSILYEVDPQYRAGVNARRRQTEKTFGASLRRLRRQKMLTREAFTPLSAKTIARIERNEIRRPHGKTLKAIARRLGVLPEEIETY